MKKGKTKCRSMQSRKIHVRMLNKNDRRTVPLSTNVFNPHVEDVKHGKVTEVTVAALRGTEDEL